MLSVIALCVVSAIVSPQLHVEGTKIVDPHGVEFRVHGVNICSLEWTSTGDHIQKSVPVALDQWHANFIRLPMSQDRWFGKSPDSRDDGSTYRSIIDWVVQEVERRGKYVLIDLQWSDCGQLGRNIGGHELPDANSLKFWQDCARRYANRPSVLFDLYNEPRDASWEDWRNGGPITEEVNGQKLTYQAVGMQTLVDAIRAVGASNLILAGGLGSTTWLSGIIDQPLKEKSGYGIVYADHFYPGWQPIERWEPMIAAAKRKLPLIVSEFGADRGLSPLDDPKRRVVELLEVLKKLDLNWIAWCMHPGAHPCLITDWTYKKSPDFGQLVYDALNGIPLPAPVRVWTTADAVVFDGKLENGFEFKSSGKVSLDGNLCHIGTPSITVDLQNNAQLQLGAMMFDGIPYKSIVLWLNGGAKGGQQLRLAANGIDGPAKSVKLPALKAGEWARVEVSFESLGIAENDHVKGFSIGFAAGPNQPPFFVDDVKLIGRKS